MYTVQCPPFYWKVNGRKNTAHIHQIHNAENIHLGGLLCTFYLYESKTLLLSFLPISYIYNATYNVFLEAFSQPNPPILFLFGHCVVQMNVAVPNVHHITQSTSTATEK